MNIAVVTGASSGLGREFVKQISEKYKTIDEIWVLARRTERLTALKNNIKSVTIQPITCDITDQEQLAEYKKLLELKKPSIRVLVNAAGYGMIGHFEDISEKDNCGMCDINVTGLTEITHISLPYMREGRANIINLASSAAFAPQPSFAVYAATKAYVKSFSTALGRELAYRGICVTAVCPGPVKTEFFEVAEKYTQTKLFKKMFKAAPKKVVAKALRDAYHNSHFSVYGITMKLYRIAAKIFPSTFIVKFLS
ncbi:MAG: SDR family NAD(P)-dependent oxidoreductase [Clostridium sp.]|nr:SDR family NAD(P)-dependent oxidoreductase [Clostridium sp.]MCM1398795.1 SDR family NAD(P)-dependent oxidoreductase [Clostridium sp.]MCM1458573.1 SDR family NAD(P)-dependent oxidoreductase [Bacteroides sp.]